MKQALCNLSYFRTKCLRPNIFLNKNCTFLNYSKLSINMNIREASLSDVIKEINANLKKDYKYEDVTLVPLSLAKEQINDTLKSLIPGFKIDKHIQPSYYFDGSLWHSGINIGEPINKKFKERGTLKKQAELRLYLSVLLWSKYCKEKWVLKNHVSPKKTSHIQCLNIANSHTFIKTEQFSRSYSTDVKSNDVQENQESIISDKKLSILFANPKGVLNNVFDAISKEFKNSSLKPTPIYKTVKKSKSQSHWVCSYKIKWPNEQMFTSVAFTKKEAAVRCAAVILSHLYDNKAIDKQGYPILYNKEQVKVLKQDDKLVLSLSEEEKQQMDEIISLHTNKIMPILTEEKQVKEIDELSNEDNSDVKTYFQKNYSYDTYKCKEKYALPISDYKEEFLNLLDNNSVVIVKGEPGCGKSTRIPQYILESWAKNDLSSGKPCKIAVTQPRRIAALSLAERVSYERDESVGEIVGYQVRFNTKFSRKTGKILYCTGGVLLRHLQSDPKLSQYSHIVLDEAHERDVNTDLLMALLKKITQENKHLKIIIMSATIDTDLFQNYYPDSAVMHVPGLVYPVKSFFLDQCKSIDLSKTMDKCDNDEPMVVPADVTKLLLHIHRIKPEGAILCFLPGWEDIRSVRDMLGNRSDFTVMCLHSRLNDLNQRRIFQKPPPGVRKIILSTNIAETSVTISDVRYVVDSGVEKDTRFDTEKGIMCMDNHWISQASMIQRKGRAGRTQGGECFHLYPKENASLFPKYSMPEILRSSLTKLVLDSKIYTDEIKAVDFFKNLPTPPEEDALKLALNDLSELELINEQEQLTPLGKLLADFQLEPKLAKTLVNSVIFKCITPVVDIITLFSQDTNLFETSFNAKDKIKTIKSKFSKSSDHLAMMLLFEKWVGLKQSVSSAAAANFCQEANLVEHKLKHLESLAAAHFGYLENGLKSVFPLSDDYSDNNELVKAVLYSGVGTFLQLRNWEIVKGQMKKSKVLLTRMGHKATLTSDSVNARKLSLPCNLLLYINETRSNIRRITLIRECSVLPVLTALLFSHKSIKIHNIDEDKFSTKLNSNNQVLLSLEGTKLEILADKEQALLIMQCKMALNSCYDYYIYQLTEGGEYKKEMNQLWNEILKIINDILNKYKTD